MRRRHRARVDQRKKLLDRLTKECGFPDRGRLERAINDAEELYTTREYWDYENARFPNTLHELREPLWRVIKLLDSEGNIHTILQALGDAEEAVERLEELLRDLRKIWAVLPLSAPPSRKRGKPPRENFHELVRELIDLWESQTKTKFKPYFVRGVPRNRATFFVCAVVELIDAHRVGSVKKVAEKLIERRRCGASEGCVRKSA